MALGRKTGGRVKGSRTIQIQRQGNRLVIKASERIRQILEGKLPCSVCRGVGRTKYQPKGPDGKTSDRTCLSCYGSKFEQLSPELIARTALSIREEAYPKLKAVEHTGAEGGPLQAAITVRFVESNANSD